MKLRLDRTIKVGDLLTSATILLSVVGLLLSWSKDRELQIRKDADSVRVAVAKCVTKLDRWQRLQLSMYDELEAEYVSASEKLALEPEARAPIRDSLWKTINAVHLKIASRVSDEEIETAYADLLATYPTARGLFLDALSELRKIEDTSLTQLLEGTQLAVLRMEPKGYVPAHLGNALRKASADAKGEFLNQSSLVLDGFRQRLFALIELPDAELVVGRQSGANSNR